MPPGEVLWQHFKEAYEWDVKHNSLRIHRKLTLSHVAPDQGQKMRNHLPTDVLGSDMLHLTTGDSVNGTINFLEQTSELIAIYTDKRPIRSLNDAQLSSLADLLRVFQSWEGFWKQNGGFESHILTKECYDDTV